MRVEPGFKSRGAASATLGIGEVARHAGVRASTLRFYERTGVLPRPARVNGRRRYTPELVRLVEIARFAQAVGFTLEEIRALFTGATGEEVPHRWRPLAEAKLRQLDQKIRRVHRMKAAIAAGLACGCIRAEDCPSP